MNGAEPSLKFLTDSLFAICSRNETIMKMIKPKDIAKIVEVSLFLSICDFRLFRMRRLIELFSQKKNTKTKIFSRIF